MDDGQPELPMATEFNHRLFDLLDFANKLPFPLLQALQIFPVLLPLVPRTRAIAEIDLVLNEQSGEMKLIPLGCELCVQPIRHPLMLLRIHIAETHLPLVHSHSWHGPSRPLFSC